MMDRLKGQPVAIAAAVRAVLVAAIAFGLDLSGEQVAAVVGAVEVLAGLWTWKRVIPTHNVIEAYTIDDAWDILTDGAEVDWEGDFDFEEEEDADDSE